MRRRGHAISWCLLAVALVAGTLSDRALPRTPKWEAGYRVLAVDLHVHPFPTSASTIAPGDLVLEARRQGLDAIAITGHNETISGKLGRWFSRIVGGPTVIAGEEIHGPRFHMIAVGIGRTIDWRLTAEQTIDEIHRQGGVAIAAHPTSDAWPAYDERAMGKLDGTEVGQPASFRGAERAQELRDFRERSGAAAIGSSDWHGMGPMGLFRTYVYAKNASEAAILEAIRARRTRVGEYTPPPRNWLQWLSAVCGIAGLAGIAVFSSPMGPSRHDPPPTPGKAPAGV